MKYLIPVALFLALLQTIQGTSVPSANPSKNPTFATKSPSKNPTVVPTQLPTAAKCTKKVADYYTGSTGLCSQANGLAGFTTLASIANDLRGVVDNLVTKCKCDPNWDQTAATFCSHPSVGSKNLYTAITQLGSVVWGAIGAGVPISSYNAAGMVTVSDVLVNLIVGGSGGTAACGLLGGSGNTFYGCAPGGTGCADAAAVTAIVANLTTKITAGCTQGTALAAGLSACAGLDCNKNLTDICNYNPAVPDVNTIPLLLGANETDDTAFGYPLAYPPVGSSPQYTIAGRTAGIATARAYGQTNHTCLAAASGTGFYGKVIIDTAQFFGGGSTECAVYGGLAQLVGLCAVQNFTAATAAGAPTTSCSTLLHYTFTSAPVAGGNANMLTSSAITIGLMLGSLMF